jgi:hypothetical protein
MKKRSNAEDINEDDIKRKDNKDERRHVQIMKNMNRMLECNDNGHRVIITVLPQNKLFYSMLSSKF